MKRFLFLMIIFLLVAIAAKNEVTAESVCAAKIAPAQDPIPGKAASAFVRMIDL